MPDSTPLNVGWSLNPAPEIQDDILIEVIDSDNTAGTYERLEPGTPHPDQDLYPGYLFLCQKTTGHNRVNRYWSTPAFYVQDWYNWEEDYVQDSATHPIFARRYKIRRDQYATLTKATPLTGVWQIKVTAPGSGYDPQDPPLVSITGGAGSGATAKALVSPDGTIAWVQITAEGTGYTDAGTLAVAFSSGAATAEATIQATSCVLIKQSTNNFGEDDPRFGLFLIETRIYQTFPGPVLTTWEYQERIREYVRIDKQLVLKSTVPADPNALPVVEGVTTEYQDLSAVYSAKITTTVPDDIAWENGADDFVYHGTVQHRFPDEVQEDPVIIIALIATSETYAIDYGWQIKVVEGYAGPCDAEIRERYTFDPEDTDFTNALPVPTSVFPKAETVFVRTYGVSASGQTTARVLTFSVPLTLHPRLIIRCNTNGIITTPPNTAFSEPVEATVPEGFGDGDSMVLVSEPQRVGIGGLWMVRIYTIYHPVRVPA